MHAPATDPVRTPTTSLGAPPVREVVVCSFHTPDEYYASHAQRLGADLQVLGVRHEIHEVAARPGEDWADVTRRKIGFVREACHRHPAALVLWIDVDCTLTHLPDYVRNTTADLIGFQRSFRSPLHIGYHNRTRFWEPSFLGFNATPGGRRLIEDAYALERRSTLKATDDYFLEEAWRANAAGLTFQMLPSTAILRPETVGHAGADTAFFSFGSSGNVAQFKDRVVQHGGSKDTTPRRKLLGKAKQIERAMPESARKPVRRLVDTVGVTGALTADAPKGLDPERTQQLKAMLHAGMSGDAEALTSATTEFDNRYVVKDRELATRQVAEAFAEYSIRGSDRTVKVAWWAKPYPGNFGDWLSPLVLAHHTDANLRLQPVAKATKKPHLVGLGSIGRFIRPCSIVVGTGISRDDIELAGKARYVSVRGPITASVLRRSGGPKVEEFGDPGVLLSRVLPMQRGATNGRIALVRHFSDAALPIRLPEGMDELSVLMSRLSDIEAFVATLLQYDAVLTSAMHVMATCQGYGIPCGLITFEGFEGNVHGNGIKYADYALGADIEVMTPQVVGLDLRRRSFDDLIRDIQIGEETKDRVEQHMRTALGLVLDAGAGKGARKGARKGAGKGAGRAKDGGRSRATADQPATRT
jgi:hypothetical protein